MTKSKIILIAFVLLSACNKPAKEISSTNNAQITIELLFEKDGCKVYRFEDRYYRYFTNCTGGVSWNETCGKNCSREVNIQTNKRSK